MENELEISRETIRKIIVEDIGKLEICARFVLHCLPNVQKAVRLQAFQEFIQSVFDRSLLDFLVTGDETWCFQYDPLTKRKNIKNRSPSYPRSNNFEFKSENKK
jgi:hypothetical protein